MTSLKTSEKETVLPTLNAVRRQNEKAQCQTDFKRTVCEQVKPHICVKQVKLFEKMSCTVQTEDVVIHVKRAVKAK